MFYIKRLSESSMDESLVLSPVLLIGPRNHFRAEMTQEMEAKTNTVPIITTA